MMDSVDVAHLTIGFGIGVALVVFGVVFSTQAQLRTCEFIHGTPCEIQATVKTTFTLSE